MCCPIKHLKHCLRLYHLTLTFRKIWTGSLEKTGQVDLKERYRNPLKIMLRHKFIQISYITPTG